MNDPTAPAKSRGRSSSGSGRAVISRVSPSALLSAGARRPRPGRDRHGSSTRPRIARVGPGGARARWIRARPPHDRDHALTFRPGVAMRSRHLAVHHQGRAGASMGPVMSPGRGTGRHRPGGGGRAPGVQLDEGSIAPGTVESDREVELERLAHVRCLGSAPSEPRPRPGPRGACRSGSPPEEGLRSWESYEVPSAQVSGAGLPLEPQLDPIMSTTTILLAFAALALQDAGQSGSDQPQQQDPPRRGAPGGRRGSTPGDVAVADRRGLGEAGSHHMAEDMGGRGGGLEGDGQTDHDRREHGR